jgi:hypothetical protein
MTDITQTPAEQPAPDLSMLDVIGTLYASAEPDTTPVQVQVPGWHVNSPWPVAGWEAHKVNPTTPRRVFAGAPTHCYTFASDAAFLEAAAIADLRPPATVPQWVTRRQARQALLLAGKLAQVQPAIDAIAEPVQRGMVQIEWDDSLHFERNRPALLALATALGMSNTDLDALFVTAATL